MYPYIKPWYNTHSRDITSETATVPFHLIGWEAEIVNNGDSKIQI